MSLAGGRMQVAKTQEEELRELASCEYIWNQGGDDTRTRFLRAVLSLEFNVSPSKYSL